jgi:hypothetical protein
MKPILATMVLVAALLSAPVRAHESIWVEAEWLNGITGYCWPGGKPEMRKTDGHWGLSGPGWAAEWTQGGESAFLSIACGPGDAAAVVSRDIEIPADDTYHVWVRYADVREKTERFQVRLEQAAAGAKAWTGTYGERAVIEEDNEMKLYWNWAFAWDHRDAVLKKGPAKLSLRSAFPEDTCRQVDVIVLTTDDSYRPQMKEEPSHPSTAYLAMLRDSNDKLEPLARAASSPTAVPAQWKPRTFRDRGFVYLWNVPDTVDWMSDDPKRVRHPHGVTDADVRKAFEAKYGGVKDVPIFSDPRIVPTINGVGPRLLQTDSPDPKVKQASQRFVKWLDENPERAWATMMNYFPDTPLSPGAYDNYMKYRDRYVGGISGENLGYYALDEKQLAPAIAGAKTRRQLVQAFTPVNIAANGAKYRKVLGRELTDPFRDVIACLSASALEYAPVLYDWGSRTVGFESSSAQGSMLSMHMAFLRGAARQNAGTFATYRSCNFGDGGTIFTKSSSFTGPEVILDNFYDPYSGAGMTWFKMDLWYQYMAGSAMFYHEYGGDEFWMPGGMAAGRREVELSPKGKLVDRFLRLTAKEPDRGTPYTPVAFLVDYAAGWDPTQFWPGEWSGQPIPRERTPIDDHWLMMKQYMWTAYHPIGPISERPMTSTSEVYVPGVFGDIFDVTYAYPDAKRWTTIDTYPVVIVTGDIELTAGEGARLNQYVESGGTALISDAQLTGPGATALKLPSLGAPSESTGYHWMGSKDLEQSQRFVFKPVTATGAEVIATSSDGQPICVSIDRGKGRLVFVSIPRGMGIDRTVVPIIPRLFARLTSGLMPVTVRGDVEWSVNRADSGWLVTLLNPAGQGKPQHGIIPTDYRQNRVITIHSTGPVKSVLDRLLPEDQIGVRPDGRGGANVTLTVPAGSVRIIELN